MKPRFLRWALAASIGLFLCADVTVSIEETTILELGTDDAEAVVGRPATPGSVAGVARRSVRRTTYRSGYYY